MAHIFHAGFITPKQKFWCAQALNEAGVDLPPPWSVDYNETTKIDVWPGKYQEY